MAVQKIGIGEFLQNNNLGIVIDVRSPLEFEHAHIPGAYSLPLFDNDQRAIVGPTYKKQSREKAIKIALPMFGDKMLSMVNQVEKWVHDFEKNNNGNKPSIFVHCWRGGMRSAAVAWLLDLYGFKVIQIIGGYKAYRNWVIEQFSIPLNIKVIGGYTGSGKTEILQTLQSKGAQIIDLENLANHKGSAFGAIGQAPQPSQEMFENLLGKCIANIHDKNKTVWIEDESQRIGTVMVPTTFFNLMRSSICYFINIPFNERLNFIIAQYGIFDKASLIAATERIQKRLGGLETKNAIQFIENGEIKLAFEILLKYYDKWYDKFSKATVTATLQIINLEASLVNETKNAQMILALEK